MHHPLISKPLIKKILSILLIDRSERSPNRYELLLLLRKVPFFSKALPKTGNNGNLLRRQIGAIIFQFPQITDISKKHISVDQIFINLIEIRQEHIAPKIELVKGFVMIPTVHFVQFSDQLDTITAMDTRDLLHQIVNLHKTRLPYRSLSNFRERIGKKKLGTTAGK